MKAPSRPAEVKEESESLPTERAVLQVPLMDPRDEQEVRIAEAAERRNLALAEAARHERRRDRELGEAVAARAPGGRWKRMSLQRKKSQKS